MTGPWIKKQMFTPVSKRKKQKAPERNQKRPWVGISSYIRWIILPQLSRNGPKFYLLIKFHFAADGVNKGAFTDRPTATYVASLRWNVWKGPNVEERQEEDVFQCIRWSITSIKAGLHWLVLLELGRHSKKFFSTKIVSSCKEITSRVD